MGAVFTGNVRFGLVFGVRLFGFNGSLRVGSGLRGAVGFLLFEQFSDFFDKRRHELHFRFLIAD
jgi:hypothetical protein